MKNIRNFIDYSVSRSRKSILESAVNSISGHIRSSISHSIWDKVRDSGTRSLAFTRNVLQ